jgi:hypothetical protein
MKSPKEIRHEFQRLWSELESVHDRMDLLRKECSHINWVTNETAITEEGRKEKYCDDCGEYIGQLE